MGGAACSDLRSHVARCFSGWNSPAHGVCGLDAWVELCLPNLRKIIAARAISDSPHSPPLSLFTSSTAAAATTIRFVRSAPPALCMLPVVKTPSLFATPPPPSHPPQTHSVRGPFFPCLNIGRIAFLANTPLDFCRAPSLRLQVFREKEARNGTCQPALSVPLDRFPLPRF